MSKILSDNHLVALGYELREKLGREHEGKPSNPDLYLRDGYDFGQQCFPIDGYLCWQHRWFMGTGLKPHGW